ncbi:MAG: DinB family protein [bacterium]|nr:DinB family protein [bacterium]
MESDRIPWTERTFDFEFPAGLRHELLVRLRGTPARVAESARSAPADMLTKRRDESWSIQENVGHLVEVEPLWLGRLDDYDAGLEVLRPADMSNRTTHEADYNAQPLEDVLCAFGNVRSRLVARLERLAPDRFSQSAHHPRLDQPMRIVDLMLFAAEHDDYHLAHIVELIRRLR